MKGIYKEETMKTIFEIETADNGFVVAYRGGLIKHVHEYLTDLATPHDNIAKIFQNVFGAIMYNTFECFDIEIRDHALGYKCEIKMKPILPKAMI